MGQHVRQSSILVSDCEDDFIIFLFGEGVEEREESGLDGVGRHEGGHDGDFVDRVHSARDVVSVQPLLEQLQGVDVLHPTQTISIYSNYHTIHAHHHPTENYATHNWGDRCICLVMGVGSKDGVV